MSADRPFFPKVIHVEGMDLAGKSTATQALASFFPGCTLSRNALTPRNPIYDFADGLRRDDRASSESLGHLYVAALLADLDAVSEPSNITIQDSTILLRSLAFNHVLGLDRVVSNLLDLVPRHPRFGVTIVLTASIDARLGRLDERRRTAPREVAPDDLMIVTAPATFVRMEEMLIGYARELFAATVVDTTELTKAEVYDTVVSLCSSMQATL